MIFLGDSEGFVILISYAFENYSSVKIVDGAVYTGTRAVVCRCVCSHTASGGDSVQLVGAGWHEAEERELILWCHF